MAGLAAILVVGMAVLSLWVRRQMEHQQRPERVPVPVRTDDQTDG